MPDTLPILDRLFRRECTSLAQYLGESWPWTHRDDAAAQELVRSIMADERRWAEQLASLIDERGGVARTGNYPTQFTDTHFLALDFMLRRLADSLGDSLPSLHRDTADARDDSLLESLLAQMIERKRGQIDALGRLAEQLTSAQAVAAL